MFVREFWDTVPGAAPLKWNWHMGLLCDKMQANAERLFRDEPKEQDLLINISPGTSKSTICSILFHPWTWTRMPRARHIVASHTDSLVLDLSNKARAVIEGEKYQACFPEIKLRKDQNTKTQYANTFGGDRISCTVGGKPPTGFHAHFIGIDDPIDPKKARSDVSLKEALSFMTDVIPSRKVDKVTAVTTLIMQRLHQNDPSGLWMRMIEDGTKIEHLCIPAELHHNINPPELRDMYVDGLMDPVRLNREVLEGFKMQGQYSYSGQFLQDPVPLGGGMFRTDRIEVVEEIPRDLKRVVRFWDKAGSHDDGAFTVGCKMGFRWQRDTSGKPYQEFFVLDIVRGQWESMTRERTIKQTALMDGKSVIVRVEQEPGSAGKESAENTIRNLAGFRVKAEKPTGEKHIRADPYSCQVNAGNVKMLKGAWNREYLEELRFFPSSTYKDQVDASSGAFQALVQNKTRVGAF
jgi:predicted phage terminase large subunit-like protein